MNSLTHAAVITALITHTVTIHGEQHKKQNQRRTIAHRLYLYLYQNTLLAGAMITAMPN